MIRLIPHETSITFAVKAAAGAAAGIAYLFGAQFVEMLWWIIALMVADHVTAIFSVIVDPREHIRWEVFTKGLLKKFALLLAFIPAGALDRGFVFMELLPADRHPTVAFIIISLVVHESGSNVKNIMRAAGQLPFLVELARRAKMMLPQEGKPYGRRETDIRDNTGDEHDPEEPED